MLVWIFSTIFCENIFIDLHTAIRLNQIFLPLFHPSNLSFIFLHFACKKMAWELVNGGERVQKSVMGQSILP